MFAVPAYGQSITERAAGALGVAPSTDAFVSSAAMSDMFEIESSKLAQQKANANSKKFAAKMIADHTKTSSELKSLVGSGKVKASLPTAMDSSHQSKIEKLKGLGGADFDKEYGDMQISAHRDAVSLFERYGKGGDSPALKRWAAKTLPHLRAHLKSAEQLKR